MRVNVETYNDAFYKHKVVVKNDAGRIVTCLYVMENGNLHVDSWTKNVGW